MAVIHLHFSWFKGTSC